MNKTWKHTLFLCLTGTLIIATDPSYGMESEDSNSKVSSTVKKLPQRIYESSEAIQVDNEGYPYIGNPITANAVPQNAPVPLWNDAEYGLAFSLDEKPPQSVSKSPSSSLLVLDDIPNQSEIFQQQETKEIKEGKNLGKEKEEEEEPSLKEKTTSKEKPSNVADNSNKATEDSDIFQQQMGTPRTEEVKFLNLEVQVQPNEGTLISLSGKQLVISVHQEDKRTKVPDPFDYSWLVHCHLHMTYRSGSAYVGSGILISNRCVLTAAHNLYKRTWGVYPQTIDVCLGMKEGGVASIEDGGKEIVLKAKGKGIAIHPKYPSAAEGRDSWGCDIGIICLDIPFGTYMDPAKYQVQKDNLSNLPVRISGYPSQLLEKGRPKDLSLMQQSLYTMKGTTDSSKDGNSQEDKGNFILYGVQTSVGQSGSGVCHEIDSMTTEDTPCCFAVHTYGPHPNGSNIGTLIGEKEYVMIQEWIKRLENIR